LNEPALEPEENGISPADPVAPEDVASAARSCFVILLVGAALVLVVVLYLVLGWIM
jgi:hypothetical protein